MSDSAFRWLVVIALWALVVIQLGTALGLDALLKPMMEKVDDILQRME